jgi:hypothetical protein
MKKRTTEPDAGTWITALLDRLDRFAFRELDLRATARGWQVRRGRRFQRTYRDPRWDTIRACPTCAGRGDDGARTCAGCNGAGTIRQEPAELAGGR